MGSFLAQGLRALTSAATAAAAKLDEAEVHNLQSKEKGNVDLGKVRLIISEFSKQLDLMTAAIDQLQQRLSNVENVIARLDATRSESPRVPPPPVMGEGNWINNPPPGK